MRKSVLGVLAILSALFIAGANGVSAQGALTVNTTPTVTPWGSNGSAGVAFDIVTGNLPIRLHRFSIAPSSSTLQTVSIWHRTTGGISLNYPPASTADWAFATGWVNLGSVQVDFSLTGANVVEIPLNLNLPIPPNTRNGFAIVGSSLRYWGTGTAAFPQPHSVSDANIEVFVHGFGGAANAAPLPGQVGIVGSGHFFPRGFGGIVSYDIDQLPGTHVSVNAVRVNSGNLLELGPNGVVAEIKNMGTTALDNTPIHAEYSTDGGSTWSTPQVFTFPSFPVLSSQTASFTTPWNVATIGQYELRVRLVAPTPVGQGDAMKSATYTPDADLTLVGGTGPNGALALGANTIQVEVKNDGSFSLNGATIPMQYSRDNGTTWLPSTPHPFVGGPALATTNGTQLFQFPGTESFASGSATLLARIQPPLNGDPDTADVTTATQAVGMQTIEILATNPTATIASSTLGTPFNTVTYRMNRTNWIILASELTAAGLSAGDPISGMSVMTGIGTPAFTAAYENVRIGLKHTTAATLTYSLTHLQPTSTFSQVGGPTTVPLSMLTPSTYIDFPFHTSFIWNGIENICVDFQNENAVAGIGGLSVTLASGLTGARVIRGYNNTGAYPLETMTSGGATPTGQIPRTRFFTPIPANQDLDIESVSFGPSQVSAVEGPSVGNNTVHVTVKNSGILAITNTFGLSYSTNGGSTWTASQSVTPVGLAVRHDAMTVTLTQPWNVAAVGVTSILVRIDPQIAGDPDPVDQESFTFNPDADVIQSGGIGPNGALVLGANTLAAVVQNNGSFSLEGVTIPMQYSLDNGTTWLPTTPHPFVGGTALASKSGTQLFQFPGTVTLASGSVTVMARIQPPLSGDPDTSDMKSTTHLVGMQTLEILATNPTATIASSTLGTPFNTVTYRMNRTNWIILASELTAAGINAGDPLNGMSVMTGIGTPAFTAAYENVRIGLKHTTAITLTYASTHQQPTSTFTNVGGPITVPVVDLVPSTYIDFPFHTPFIWNGTDNICVDFQNENAVAGVGGLSVTLASGLTGARIIRGYNNTGSYPLETMTSGGATPAGQIPRTRFFTPVPPNQDIDIVGVAFGTTPASATPGVALGNNLIHVTLVNAGIQAVTNTFGLSYSTDGGTTWTPPQTITPVGLAARHDTMVASLTTPWNLTVQAAAQLKVRIDPPLAGDPDPVDEESYSYTPDLDIELVSTNPPPTLTQPISIRAHVRNNGNWSANGVPITLRYALNASATWVTQTFTPASLGGNGDIEVFTFTQTISLPFGSNTTVDVEFSPQFAGDPDAADVKSLLIPDQSVQYPLQLQDPVASGIPATAGVANANRGWLFQANVSNKVVKRLGCWYPNSDVDSKTMVLWHITSPAPATTSGNIIASGPTTPGPGWTWYDLPNPVPLIQGERYIIMAHSVLAPYHFSNTVPASWHPTTDIVYMEARWVNTATPQTFPGSIVANAHYGVVDIGYGDPSIPGNHIKADAAQLGSGGAVVGNNTVEAVLRNLGTTDHSNLPVTVKYSTDNGTTWSAPQTFTFPSFPPLATVTATFTAPWSIPTIGNYNLMVEIDPPIGTAGASASAQIRPSPIIDDIGINAATAQIGVPHIVQATIKNEGGFNLTGVPIGMRYRVNQGTWVTENISATNLPVGATQVINFTQPVVFPTQGTYQIEVEQTPSLPGDSGTSGKSFSKTWADVGLLIRYVGAATLPGMTRGTNAFPIGLAASTSPTATFMTIWTPQQLAHVGFIESFGWQSGSMAASVSRSWANVKYYMGYSTVVSPVTTALPYMSYFSSPPTLVYDGPITATSTGVDSYFERTVLTTPFLYDGIGNLCLYCEFTGPSGSAGSQTVYTGGTPSQPNFRVANTNGITPGVVSNNYVLGASFSFTPPYDPGLKVERAGVKKDRLSTDNVGVINTANQNNTLTYQLINQGGSQNLTITSINVNNLSNVAASVSPTAPTSVPFGGAPSNLELIVNPLPGPYSFDVTIVSNTAEPSAGTFTWTVSGTGFVNTAPTISVLALPPLQASGVSPNLQIEGVMGDSLASAIVGNDVDSHQNLTVTITEAAGGTISAAAAGFTNTFPITVPAGSPPNSALMAGTAIAAGTVVFTVNVVDNGVFPLSHLATVTYRIGARVDVNTMNADSLFVRVSGVKDFYRGEVGRPISMTMTNSNPFPVTLQSMSFLPRIKGTQTILTGFTFNLVGAPLTIPANTTNMAISATMDIAANASGANGATVELILDSALAVDPVNPTTNPIVVKILDPIDEFNLYNGPVPQPMMITMTAFQPAVETVSFLQDLTVSGGLGSYTWSIAPGSASGLPAGLTLNPNGNQFLAASIQGTPAAGTSNNSPYVITLRVSDTAYQADITLTMTVSPLLPLSLAPVTMPQGQEFVAYPGVVLSASGGSQIFNYGVSFGSVHPLPAGLTLNPQTGVISGTPADQSQGVFTITFEVSDGIGSVTQTTSLTIIAHPLQWRSTTIAAGEATVAYSASLDAIGGTGPRIYSIVSGTLPTGLTLNPVNGLISGTPAQGSANSYPVTFRVTDGLNVSVNQVITLVIAVPAPLVVTTTQLNYAQVGQSLSQTITAAGGSRNYTFTVGAGTLNVPTSVALSALGVLTANPVRGDEGRFPITIVVNDGFGTASTTLSLTVLPEGADEIAITEIDVSTGYIEFTNLGSDPVDVSGWKLMAWVDGNTPLALVLDSVPGVSLSLPTEPVTFVMGGTAGGFYPNYSTGTPWTATSSSSLAVALFDRFGNAIDFVHVGAVNIGALQDATANPAKLPAFITDKPAIQSGAANHSLVSTGWASGAVGSQGVYNSGLPAVPTVIVRDSFHVAVAGEAYFDFALAIGGVKPYTWSLVAPSATWLSINPTTGFLTGTPPAGAAGSFTIDITCTPAAGNPSSLTVPFTVVAATAVANHTITVGTGSGQSFAGTEIDIPVTYSKSGAAQDVDDIGFLITLPTATAAQVKFLRVSRGPALTPAIDLLAKEISGSTVAVQISGDSTMIPVGVVAVVRVFVPFGGPDATEGIYAVEVSSILAQNSTAKFRASGVNGTLEMNNYSPADVNRDGNINVVDVQRTVNIILGSNPPTYLGQGDVNGDGNVNVVDVQRIVNCILNSANCP